MEQLHTISPSPYQFTLETATLHGSRTSNEGHCWRYDVRSDVNAYHCLNTNDHNIICEELLHIRKTARVRTKSDFLFW